MYAFPLLQVFEYAVPKDKEHDPGARRVFSLKHEAKDAKEWISDVKFTPDGKTVAVRAEY
jgi:hypothetical protein